MPSAVPRLRGLLIPGVGGGVDDELRSLARPYGDHVRFEGYVDDLGATFGSACALLAPLVIGYGLKIKTLAAMYYGLPMLATSEGVEGFALRPGEDFILEDDLSRFPDWMERLCDPDCNAALSANAESSYRRQFSKDAVYVEYDALFGPAPPDGRAAGASRA
jgi:glycosyltransferase involved in cell wall biosynthesis